MSKTPIRSETMTVWWCLACKVPEKSPFQTTSEDVMLAHIDTPLHRRRAVVWLEKQKKKGLVRA